MPERQINLRGSWADHTVTWRRRGAPLRPLWVVTVSPDDPLVYGYEEASALLEDPHVARLLHWLNTGTALGADHRVPVLPTVWGSDTPGAVPTVTRTAPAPVMAAGAPCEGAPVPEVTQEWVTYVADRWGRVARTEKKALKGLGRVGDAVRKPGQWCANRIVVARGSAVVDPESGRAPLYPDAEDQVVFSLDGASSPQEALRLYAAANGARDALNGR